MIEFPQLSFDIDNYESVTVRKRRMHIEKIIESLGLQKHPIENGYSKEIFRSQLYVDYPPAVGEKRNFCAGIYYLLSGKEYSPWHRLKNSEELWMFHSGSTLNIYMISDEGDYSIKKLGSKLATRDPLTDYEVHIPVNTWFACEVFDKTSYCLATVTIAPSQESEDFEIKTVEELQSLFPQYADIIQKFGPRTADAVDDNTDTEQDDMSEQNSDKMVEADKMCEHDGGLSCRSDTSGNVSNDNDECSKGGSESEDSEPLSDLSYLGLSDFQGKDTDSGHMFETDDDKRYSNKMAAYASQVKQYGGMECQNETLNPSTGIAKLPLITNGDG